MKNSVIIFTMKGCPYCLDLKTGLTEKNITYYEYMIHDHKNIWEQVVKQTGFRNLPTVYIKEGDSDIGPVFIPGRDFDTKEQIIEIIQGYL
jgi:glutaredoxin